MSQLQIATNSENEQKIVVSARELISRADVFVIKTDDDYTAALDLIKMIDVSAKRAEDERKGLTGPINDVLKNINSRFKTITEPLEKAKALVKQKALAYHQKMEAIRREKEQREREEREKQELEARKAEEASRIAEGVETAPESQEQPVDRSLKPQDDHVLDVHNLKIPPLTNTKPSVRTESGTLGTVKKVWKYRVVDIQLLARTNPAAIQVNHEGVMHCIKSGVRDMPGLEIYQEEILAVR